MALEIKELSAPVDAAAYPVDADDVKIRVMQQNTLNGDGAMLSITEFLEARIAEDEAAARATAIPEWSIDRAQDPMWVHGLCISAADSNWDACIDVADAEHATRHDPARVLAECASKRAVLDVSVNWDGYTRNVSLLRALALAFKDHPDYQQEWAD